MPDLKHLTEPAARSTIVKPFIHVGGTDPEMLIEQYEKALRAIKEAIKFVALSAPHDRDYPVYDHETRTLVHKEHRARLDALNLLAEDYRVLLLHAVDEKTRRDEVRAKHAKAAPQSEAAP